MNKKAEKADLINITDSNIPACLKTSFLKTVEWNSSEKIAMEDLCGTWRWNFNSFWFTMFGVVACTFSLPRESQGNKWGSEISVSYDLEHKRKGGRIHLSQFLSWLVILKQRYFEKHFTLDFLHHNVGQNYATYNEVGFLSHLCYFIYFLYFRNFKASELAVQNMGGKFWVF